MRTRRLPVQSQYGDLLPDFNVSTASWSRARPDTEPHTLDLDPEGSAAVVEIVEVLGVQGRSEEGVAVHALAERRQVLKVLGRSC